VIRVWDVAGGHLLHHIPIEAPPYVTALGDDADLLVGVFGGLAVLHLNPVPGTPGPDPADPAAVLDDTWTRLDGCMTWEWTWRVPQSRATARRAEIERLVPTLLPGFGVAAAGTWTQGGPDGAFVLPVDVLVWARDAVTEVTVAAGAGLVLRCGPAGDGMWQLQLAVVLDVDLYVRRTGGILTDNDGLAALNAPRLNAFLSRIRGATPHPERTALRAADLYAAQATERGVESLPRELLAYQLVERLRRGHAVHLTNLPDDPTGYYGPFDSHVSCWPLPRGRYRCVNHLVTNDGSGLWSTTDDTLDDAAMRDRIAALLKGLHTVTDEPRYGPDPPPERPA
jgi:hypothetical protein